MKNQSKGRKDFPKRPKTQKEIVAQITEENRKHFSAQDRASDNSHAAITPKEPTKKIRIDLPDGYELPQNESPKGSNSSYPGLKDSKAVAEYEEWKRQLERQPKSSALESSVRDFIEQEYRKRPATTETQILGIKLLNQNGQEYNYLLNAQLKGVTFQIDVCVTSDGETFKVKTFKALNYKEPINSSNLQSSQTPNPFMKQIIMILILAIMIGAIIYQYTRVVADPNLLTIGGLVLCIAFGVGFLVNFIKNS